MTRFRGGGVQVSDLIFVVGIIALFFSKDRPRVEPMPVSWLVALILVVIGGVAACVVALDITLSVLVLFRLIFVILFWPWLLRSVLFNQHLKQLGMYAFVLGCAASGFAEILQKVHLYPLPAAAGGRAVGFTSQPDELGAALALGLVFAIGLTMELGLGRRWHRLISVMLISFGLILSASVSAMLAALAAVFVLLVLRRVNLRRVVTGAVVILVVYVAGTVFLGANNPIGRFQSTVGNSSTANTGTLRVDTYKAAWHGIAEQPLIGHGLDQVSGAVYFDVYSGFVYAPHNLILILWYQGGFLVLLGVLVAVLSALWRSWKARRRDPTGDIIFAGAIASLVYAQTAPIIFQTYFWLPFILAITTPLLRRPAGSYSGAPEPLAAGQPASGLPLPVGPRVNGSVTKAPVFGS
ncbi:MAG TPA: O-antigen ligase family protein [Acidimicrobiales bacterium]|jgi:O-antigen ligase|nr:O-antigen ligase family protein [Acidimicrobiales bacterium]